MEQVTQEDQLSAAKQLLMELKTIKNSIYASRTKINSLLIVQLKQVLRGLITKYNGYGLLKGEFITLKLSDKTAYSNIDFVYSQNLAVLMRQVVESLPEPKVEEIADAA